MKRGGFMIAVGVLLMGLFYGVAALYKLRVARGDVFPEYSSLRADPLGVRALHDAAGFLPGCESVRWLRPAERLEAGAGDVVFVVGLDDERGRSFDEDAWAALDRAAVAGARVVVAWRAHAAQVGDAKRAREMRADPWAVPEPDKAAKPGDDAKADAKTKPENEDKANDHKKADESPAVAKETASRYATQHELRWGFRLGRRELVKHAEEADAFRGEDAASAWPATLARWRSDLFFMTRTEDGWRVLYRRGKEPVMIERTRGKGSVTLMADGFVLSNEAVQRERATPVLAALIGNARRVVFVESHLGVQIESGVAVLARHYGLGGAALTGLVLAGLWIWRRATPLAPILPEEAEVRLALAPTAGLEALLRRAVSPAKLFSACVDAWRPTASANDQRRLADTPPADAVNNPVVAYNAATKTLSHKRIT